MAHLISVNAALDLENIDLRAHVDSEELWDFVPRTKCKRWPTQSGLSRKIKSQFWFWFSQGKMIPAPEPNMPLQCKLKFFRKQTHRLRRTAALISSDLISPQCSSEWSSCINTVLLKFKPATIFHSKITCETCNLTVVPIRPEYEIVERRARFSLKIQDNFKLISDYPPDLPGFRLSEVVRWPAFKWARCQPSASEWTWRSGVQVHVQSECKIKGRTLGASLTGTVKHRLIPSQWQPGRAATGTIQWRIVSQLAALAKLKLFANQKSFIAE